MMLSGTVTISIEQYSKMNSLYKHMLEQQEKLFAADANANDVTANNEIVGIMTEILEEILELEPSNTLPKKVDGEVKISLYDFERMMAKCELLEYWSEDYQNAEYSPNDDPLEQSEIDYNRQQIMQEVELYFQR